MTNSQGDYINKKLNHILLPKIVKSKIISTTLFIKWSLWLSFNQSRHHMIIAVSQSRSHGLAALSEYF